MKTCVFVSCVRCQLYNILSSAFKGRHMNLSALPLSSTCPGVGSTPGHITPRRTTLKPHSSRIEVANPTSDLSLFKIFNKFNVVAVFISSFTKGYAFDSPLLVEGCSE